MRTKFLTLEERWAIDIEAAKAGGTSVSSVPQCEICKYWIKGNALKCEKYMDRKPAGTLRCKKECPAFEPKHKMEIKMETTKTKQLLGGIFGAAVADAVGVPLEFTSRAERESDPVQEMRAYGTHHQYFGTWSDDSSMIFCLMDSLKDGHDLNDMADKFCKFYYENYWTPHDEVFDIGNTTIQAIERMKKGMNPIECGGRNEEDNGNGSLMRILPLSFYLQDKVAEEKLKIISEVSSLTHAHKCSQIGRFIYVEYAINLLKGYNKIASYKNVKDFMSNNIQTHYTDVLARYKNIIKGDISYLTQNRIRSSGYIVHFLEAALWSFLTSDSYKEVIFKAQNLGGDTDTIAAIAGGLAGIYYGLQEIPDKWIQCLARKEDIYDLTIRFGQIL